MVEGSVIEAIAKPPPVFKPVRAGLPSDPKGELPPGYMPKPLQAFLTLTQPVVEDYVSKRKFATEFGENPSLTDHQSKTITLNELKALTKAMDGFNHAERKIRGMPFEEDVANYGLQMVRDEAIKRIKAAENDLDDARAAELDLAELDKIT